MLMLDLFSTLTTKGLQESLLMYLITALYNFKGYLYIFVSCKQTSFENLSIVVFFL